MSIDYKALQVTTDALQEKLGELKNLIRVGREGKIRVDLIGEIEFTALQKTGLVDSYNQIKTDMVALFGDLP